MASKLSSNNPDPSSKTIMKKFLLLAALLTLPFVPGRAITVNATWSGVGAGSATWEVDGNWSYTDNTGNPISKTYPNNGTDRYVTFIGDATGDRIIQTTGDITTTRLKIVQTTSGVTNTLKLGGDFTLIQKDAGADADSGFTGVAGQPGSLVIDLNGYTFRAENYSNGLSSQSSNFTITGGGTYEVSRWYYGGAGGGITVGDNTIIKIAGAFQNSQYQYFTQWSPSSTFWYATDNATFTVNYNTIEGAGGAYGNIKIGSETNTNASAIQFNYDSRVVNNVEILGVMGGGGASAKLDIQNKTMTIGGSFIDHGTDTFSYGSGTIRFNGGNGTERTLSTGRVGIETSFQIGENAANTANIGLGKDLTTTGNFTVLKESILNIKDFTLSANNVNIQSSGGIASAISFAFGDSESGLIDATGTLTLNLATLNVAYTGGAWTNGDDLTLFEFASLSGTPSLTINAQGFTYDNVVVDTNAIYLTNVVIPEPGVFALVVLGTGSLLIRRRMRV